jgi:hypothetical protein
LLTGMDPSEKVSLLSDELDKISNSNKIKAALSGVMAIFGEADLDSHFGKNIELKAIITPDNLEILKQIFKQSICEPDVYISMIENYDIVEEIFGLGKDLKHHLKTITSNRSLAKAFTEGLDSVEKFKTLQEALLLTSDELRFLLRWKGEDICKNSNGEMLTVKEILTIFEKAKKSEDFEKFKNDNNPLLNKYGNIFNNQYELACMKELTGLSVFKEDIKEPVGEEKGLFAFLNQMQDKDVDFITPLSSLLWFLNPSKANLEGYTSNPNDIESRLESIRAVFTHKTLIELVKSKSVGALNFLFHRDNKNWVERIFNRISDESLDKPISFNEDNTFPEFDHKSELIKSIYLLNGKEIKDLAKIINYLSENDRFREFNDAAKILMSKISDEITFNEVLLLHRISESSHSKTFLKQMETYTEVRGELDTYMKKFSIRIMKCIGEYDLIILNNRVAILVEHFVAHNLEIVKETGKPYVHTNEKSLIKEEVKKDTITADNNQNIQNSSNMTSQGNLLIQNN